MKLVTVKMPDIYVEAIDILVKMGRYASRSEAIRVAVRELLSREAFNNPELCRRLGVCDDTDVKIVRING